MTRQNKTTSFYLFVEAQPILEIAGHGDRHFDPSPSAVWSVNVPKASPGPESIRAVRRAGSNLSAYIQCDSQRNLAAIVISV